MDKQLELFRALTEAPGAPGFEGDIRHMMRQYMARYTDEIVQDNLGSVFGVMRGNEAGPTIMAAAHMDEVAFMVTRVTDEGFVKFQTLGGWWSQVLLAQRVEIITKTGTKIPGVIGSQPPHILTEEARNKPVDIKDMFIDVGADSRADAEAMGVRPGMPIVPVCPFTVMGNKKKLMAKAWDNRFGCALAIELLEELSKSSHPNVVYAGAHVQEEVGLRGAATSAHMIEPDIFFALDAGPANDIPGVADQFAKLGEGTTIRLYDRSMVAHRGLRDFMLDIAESNDIKYQFYMSPGGGTDAGRVHMTGSGVPSSVIGIVSRYIHSHASIMHIDDYEQAKALLTAVVKSLDKSAVETIKNS
ncbi:M42 family metallopeptidase [Numidum massiliense]|uniref:M42 family metallopeptidase n=1 Tax=Numidum massiliense TaxID=1522315 RepID=UPI0006D5437E|nr:M42 family metallopeptidase [Numidum massiliense]